MPSIITDLDLLSKKLVIFDWDGTLIDSLPKIIDCMQKTAEYHRLEIPATACIRDVVGLSLENAISKLFGNLPPDKVTEMSQTFRAFYEKSPVASPVFQGVPEMLEYLKCRNIKLAIATGKSRAVFERIMFEKDLHLYFDCTVCGDEFPAKPHPGALQYICDSLCCLPADSIMVGDSKLDMNMAANAGIDAIAVCGGSHSIEALKSTNPLLVLNGAAELIGLFQS